MQSMCKIIFNLRFGLINFYINVICVTQRSQIEKRGTQDSQVDTSHSKQLMFEQHISRMGVPGRLSTTFSLFGHVNLAASS